MTAPAGPDPAKLEAWLSANLPGFAPPLTIERFQGGQSNPTYALHTPTAAYVMRSKPVGLLLPTAHDVLREHRVLSALAATDFPAPRPLAVCRDDGVIGAPFYVMTRAEGRILRDPTMPEQPPEARRAILLGMARTLGRLHRLDPAALGLSDFGRAEGYLERQLSRWAGQFRASAPDDVTLMEAVAAALDRARPASSRTALIHGDYKLDNVVLQADGPEVIAVLDWELSTLGDPLVDLSYLLMSWADGPMGALAADPASGVPPLPEMTAAYAETAGRDVPPSLDWYVAFNQFKLACILQGIVGRARSGTAVDAAAESFAPRVPALLETARARLGAAQSEKT